MAEVIIDVLGKAIRGYTIVHTSSYKTQEEFDKLISMLNLQTGPRTKRIVNKHIEDTVEQFNLSEYAKFAGISVNKYYTGVRVRVMSFKWVKTMYDDNDIGKVVLFVMFLLAAIVMYFLGFWNTSTNLLCNNAN